MKKSRMMFSTFVLFVAVVVAECVRLPESHDAEKEHTDLMRELRDAIHRLEARAAKRDKEVKVIADSMTRLAEGLAQIEVKTADIEMRTDNLEIFKEQGRVNSTSRRVPIRVCSNK